MADTEIDLLITTINNLKSTIKTTHDDYIGKLRSKINNYIHLNEIYDTLDQTNIYKGETLEKLRNNKDDGVAFVNTNIRKVVYEHQSTKPVKYMRIFLLILYVFASILFIILYTIRLPDIKSGISLLKIVSISLTLILFPFFILNIIYSIRYIFSLPDLLYPNTMY